MEYDNTNKGVLFQNDKDGNDQRPDYTGKLNVEGKEYRIAGWKRVGKSGKPFLSIAISEPQEQQSAQKPDTVVHDISDEPIDLNDIPF